MSCGTTMALVMGSERLNASLKPRLDDNSARYGAALEPASEAEYRCRCCRPDSSHRRAANPG